MVKWSVVWKCRCNTKSNGGNKQLNANQRGRKKEKNQKGEITAA